MSLYGENALNAMMMDLADAGIQFTQEEALCYGQYVFQKVMNLSSCVVFFCKTLKLRQFPPSDCRQHLSNTVEQSVPILKLISLNIHPLQPTGKKKIGNMSNTKSKDQASDLAGGHLTTCPFTNLQNKIIASGYRLSMTTEQLLPH